eukprot:CAMPEP_0196664212 /NCGR_PEP_ID=MMETSP1086-20130531/56163_1 /TAXON_ID=77921 /ORGANISM="Cyanoptyche  gloeocystis , Strain SAG4.97" /LENGTH=33 /DNA_ID= /DNA_START= /DNA_END= /DNA_ORIENTATION=
MAGRSDWAGTGPAIVTIPTTATGRAGPPDDGWE